MISDMGLQNVSDLGETAIVIRTCLDYLMPDVADVLFKNGLKWPDEDELRQEPVCVNVKGEKATKLTSLLANYVPGHALSSSLGAKMCLCQGDRCNMHPVIGNLPDAMPVSPVFDQDQREKQQ